MTRRLAVACCFAVTATAFGQAAQFPYEKVLVPIMAASPLPGAYGSMWVTQLAFRNDADTPVEITNLVSLCSIECPSGWTPHWTFLRADRTPDPNAGEFLYVGAPGHGKASFFLRVQDLSRQSQTWGATIPVVREGNVYTDTLQLLDVPVDTHFRSALRIYDFDTPTTDQPRQVRLRIFEMCGISPLDRDCSTALPLVDITLDLKPSRALVFNLSDTQYPATAIVGDLLGRFSQLASVKPSVLNLGLTRPPAVRIVLDPVTPGLRFWAFVSATNNETQHVTVIAPQ